MRNQSQITVLLCLFTLSMFISNASGERKHSQDNISDEKDIKMIFVLGSDFTMGVTSSEVSTFCEDLYASQTDNPCDVEWIEEQMLSSESRGITIEDFFIDKYEVSVAAYLACVEDDVCSRAPVEQESAALEANIDIATDLPVSGVTYYEAAIYCAWRQGRLPTEEEWEFAARGVEENLFAWGSTQDNVPANYCTDCEPESLQSVNDKYEGLAPIASFEEGRNWLGLYNMSGNVSEWTSTFYLGRDTRVVKGGSYQSYLYELATWMRFPVGSNLVVENVGFRCVRTTLTPPSTK